MENRFPYGCRKESRPDWEFCVTLATFSFRPVIYRYRVSNRARALSNRRRPARSLHSLAIEGSWRYERKSLPSTCVAYLYRNTIELYI